MSDVSANATGLPAFHPAICPPTPRRGFLAGLASLPLLGGGVAFAKKYDYAPEPAGEPKIDRLATFDDYAAVDFQALEVDLQAAREAHANMWTPLAMGLRLLTKSPEECCDFAASLGEDENVFRSLIETLEDGAAWYRQAADLIGSGKLRYLCGAARLIKGDEDADA